MNKTEIRYGLMLEARRRVGEILAYEFGALTLRLGDDLRYTPDWLVWLVSDGNGRPVIELHEVKGGFIRDDARVKLHAAAKQFPMFTFRKCQFTKGSWTITEVER